MPQNLACTYDGFEWRRALSSQDQIWRWAATSNQESQTDASPLELFVGTFRSRNDYRAALRFGPISVSKNESISSFIVNIFPVTLFKEVNLTIKAILSPDIVVGSNFLPSNQALTSSSVTFSTSTLSNFSATGEWSIDGDSFAVDVAPVVQEVINNDNWASGKQVTLLIDYVYDESSSGRLTFKSEEHPTLIGASAVLTTTAESTGGTSIASVNGNNVIRSGDFNIPIVGTGFNGNASLRIYKGSATAQQTITSKDNTEIRFNYSGNLPADSGYILELTIDQQITNFTITVAQSSNAGTPLIIEEVDAQLDGFEYAAKSSGFPGTWSNVTSSASQTGSTDFVNQIVVGEWGVPTNIFKASVKVGPINLPRGRPIDYFDLVLNVANNYKLTNFEIRAVANSKAADVGAGNLLSNQTLTQSSKSENTSSWINSDDTQRWTPGQNPKPIDVTAVAQEVVNSNNWEAGDSIQFVLDFTDLDGLQGYTAFWATESIDNRAAFADYQAVGAAAVSSISSDNEVSLGEKNVTIVGSNLTGATNLKVVQGATTVNQIIKFASSTNIGFDLIDGALNAGASASVEFDVSGQTLSFAFDLVQGQGVVSGEADTITDGFEKGSSLPVVGDFFEDTDSDSNLSSFNANNIIVGEWGSPLFYYNCVIEIGPFAVSRNQTFTTCDLVLQLDEAYKTTKMTIFGVADPAVDEITQENNISDQQLTTASVALSSENFAGYDAQNFWTPPATINVDVTSIVEEIISSSSWLVNRVIKFVFQFEDLGGAGGFLTIKAAENASRASYLNYVTGASRNIANVNGNNVIKFGQNDCEILGSDLLGSTRIKISFDDSFSDQSVNFSTDTTIDFDYVRGNNAYGQGLLEVFFPETTIQHVVFLEPQDGWLYVIVNQLYLGDNSLQFNADPAVKVGDILAWNATSENGFDVEVDGALVPTISGGDAVNQFDIELWDMGPNLWDDLQTVIFRPNDYLEINTVETTPIFYKEGVGEITVTTKPIIGGVPPEIWLESPKNPDEQWIEKGCED